MTRLLDCLHFPQQVVLLLNLTHKIAGLLDLSADFGWSLAAEVSELVAQLCQETLVRVSLLLLDCKCYSIALLLVIIEVKAVSPTAKELLPLI